MTDKLLCPFCNKPLQPTLRQSDEYWCENYDCPRTNIEWVGSKKLWQSLINERQHATDCQDLFIEAIAQKLEIETELERTRKALEIATHRLNQIAEHDCDQGCMYVAQNTLEQITALEKSELENLEMLVNNVFK